MQHSSVMRHEEESGVHRISQAGAPGRSVVVEVGLDAVSMSAVFVAHEVAASLRLPVEILHEAAGAREDAVEHLRCEVARRAGILVDPKTIVLASDDPVERRRSLARAMAGAILFVRVGAYEASVTTEGASRGATAAAIDARKPLLFVSRAGEMQLVVPRTTSASRDVSWNLKAHWTLAEP